MNLQNFKFEALEDYTSKSKLYQTLQISARTLYQYHEIAMYIADFEADYPSIVKNGAACTSAALTKYQCWVIFKLMVVCRRLARSWVADCLLNDSNKDFTQQFTKAEYLRCQMNEGAEDDKHQAICIAA